jgi:hypothetical protein
VALLLPNTIVAAPLVITPVAEPTVEQQRAIAGNEGVSSGIVEGAGDRVRITYSSPVPIEVNIAPLRRGHDIDPSELMFFSLPAAAAQEALVNLSGMPGWAPWSGAYYLTMSVPHPDDAVSIENVELLPASLGAIMHAIRTTMTTPERFQVSTPHTIRGTQLLGVPLTTLIAVITVLCTMVVIRWRGVATNTALGVLLAGPLLASLWFDIDLLRFTQTHAMLWWSNGTYNEQGASIAVAEHLEQLTIPNPVLDVCDNATDYVTKVIRYFAYPIPVLHAAETDPRVTHVLVRDRLVWSFADGILTCGELETPAALLTTFADGAQLFALSR